MFLSYLCLLALENKENENQPRLKILTWNHIWPVTYEGLWMVKSETHRDAKILVRNPSPRLFVKKFRDSKKVKPTMQKRDFENDQKRFWDFEILPKFSETHVFRGTIHHPSYAIQTVET